MRLAKPEDNNIHDYEFWLELNNKLELEHDRRTCDTGNIRCYMQIPSSRLIINHTFLHLRALGDLDSKTILLTALANT